MHTTKVQTRVRNQWNDVQIPDITTVYQEEELVKKPSGSNVTANLEGIVMTKLERTRSSFKASGTDSCGGDGSENELSQGVVGCVQVTGISLLITTCYKMYLWFSSAFLTCTSAC